jgi:MOSC domain-containing protein YiiM
MNRIPDYQLLSLNVGAARSIAAKRGTTGIFKSAVEGPVHVGKLGVAGDFIGDLDHHGGVDQAVYVYAQPDYEWWAEQLQSMLEPGTFGENLLVSGPSTQALCLGDRFEIGEVVLEVTSYRMPCVTLAARMGDARFVKAFNAAKRHGAYCRVLAEGHVTAGMAIKHLPFAGPKVTLVEMAEKDASDAEFVARVLQTPAHWKILRDFQQDHARS